MTYNACAVQKTRRGSQREKRAQSDINAEIAEGRRSATEKATGDRATRGTTTGRRPASPVALRASLLLRVLRVWLYPAPSASSAA